MTRRLAVSNIAWPAAADDAVAAALRERGVELVELAPTTRWPRPAEATVDDADAWRDEWRARGLRPVAAQSLLYGRPELLVFGSDGARAATVAYLDHVMRLAGRLGAVPLVFGSPANRKAGALSTAEATRIAAPFFGELAARARAHGVQLCLEPNPPQYGCDFLTDTQQCVAFLETVDAEGLGLHLDAAALALNGEDVERAVEIGAPWLRHYHASEPFLGPLGSAGVDHARHARALAAIGYRGLVSIEMKAVPDVPAAQAVAAAVDVALEAYAPVIDGVARD